MRGSTLRKLSPHRRARVGLEGGNHPLLVVALRYTVLDRMAGDGIPDSCLARSDSRNDTGNRAERLIRLGRGDVAATHEAGVVVRCSILVLAVVGSAGRSL